MYLWPIFLVTIHHWFFWEKLDLWSIFLLTIQHWFFSEKLDFSLIFLLTIFTETLDNCSHILTESLWLHKLFLSSQCQLFQNLDQRVNYSKNLDQRVNYSRILTNMSIIPESWPTCQLFQNLDQRVNYSRILTSVSIIPES